MLKFLLFVAASLVAGCLYPVAVSEDCQARINNCLEDCPQSNPVADPQDGQGSGHNLTDHRSPCERNCQSLCH